MPAAHVLLCIGPMQNLFLVAPDSSATLNTAVASRRRSDPWLHAGRGLLAIAIAIATLSGCSDGSNPEAGSDSARSLGLAGTGAGIVAVPSFGSNPGGLSLYVHVPASLPANAPVVFALHGCTQSANAYMGAGWNELADAVGFVVAYPEQTSSNNSQRCFRWWDPAHTTRDQGEAKSIRSMVDYVRSQYGVNDAYVTGLSAGGAMTAVMLATYPDVFRAGSIMSGLPYHCATTQTDAYTCMSGEDQTAAALSALLPSQAHTTPPRVSIWQGDADYTVRPANASQLVRQFAGVNGVSETPTTSEAVGKATHDSFLDTNGSARIERWIISGMGHGTALDPANGCGTAGAYLLDESLCSTRKSAEFFGILTSASGSNVDAGPKADSGSTPDAAGPGSVGSPDAGTLPPFGGFPDAGGWPGSWGLPEAGALPGFGTFPGWPNGGVFTMPCPPGFTPPPGFKCASN